MVLVHVQFYSFGSSARKCLARGILLTGPPQAPAPDPIHCKHRLHVVPAPSPRNVNLEQRPHKPLQVASIKNHLDRKYGKLDALRVKPASVAEALFTFLQQLQVAFVCC